MQPAKPEELGETLVRVARGELSLATVAGLGPEELAEILQFALRQLEAKKTAEAVRVLEGLVALDPQNPLFHEYLGLALERSRTFDRALTEYGENITRLEALAVGASGGLDERLLEGHLLRGRLRALTGDMAGAKSDLDRAKTYDRGADARGAGGPQDPALTDELRRLERALSGAANDSTGGKR